MCKVQLNQLPYSKFIISKLYQNFKKICKELEHLNVKLRDNQQIQSYQHFANGNYQQIEQSFLLSSTFLSFKQKSNCSVT